MTGLRRTGGVAWVLALLAACGEGPTEAVAPAGATFALVNGQVLTMAAGTGVAEAIAIDGARILRVGSNEAVLGSVDSTTRVIDLQGRTVLPGIVDAHTHLFNDAHRLGLDLAGGQEVALKVGITTKGVPFVTPEFLATMEAFEAAGNLKVRTSLYLVHTDNCGSVRWGRWWAGHPPTRDFGERLRIGGIKLFADGGTCGRPAVSVEFEPGSGFGDLHLTADEIADVVGDAERMGHQVVIHAIGDRAVEAAQDGIEAGLGGRSNALRHRIDHNTLVPPRLVPRYREIGIQPVVFGHLPLGILQPGPGTCEPKPRNAFYRASEGNTRLLLDELGDEGVAWHGDDPWIPPINPFRELYSMVTRIRRGDGIMCFPPDWQLETRISAEEGLRMMTVNSARALLREDEVGSLEPGKLADLVVVPANPLEIAPDALWNIKVSMTMIGGEVVFCREGHAELCPRLDR